MSIFEQASRQKLRFDSSQGQLTCEHLWEIPLTSSTGKANLDDIARSLSKKVKEAETESFVVKPAKADESDQTKFEIVKHIIKVRLEENEAAALLKTNKEKKQQILGLIAQKQNEAMAGKSVDELMAMVENL